jgi:hypothetical protein
MVEILDLQPFWEKLAVGQPLTLDEAARLLKQVEHFKRATTYLADCQAATAQGLPASASKSARQRHASLCEAAASLLDGNSTPIRHEPVRDSTQRRCLNAAAELRAGLDKTATK